MAEMSAHGPHCEELVADCRLRAAIGGMSDKVLTETLRRLLTNGLIERHTYAEAPPRTDYLLTPLGKTLVDGPMKALGHWVLEHGDELLDAQDRTTPPVR